MATFAEVSSHLIDQLRAARDTAARLAPLTDDEREKVFGSELAARIELLLDDLGCYD